MKATLVGPGNTDAVLHSLPCSQDLHVKVAGFPIAKRQADQVVINVVFSRINPKDW